MLGSFVPCRNFFTKIMDQVNGDPAPVPGLGTKITTIRDPDNYKARVCCLVINGIHIFIYMLFFLWVGALIAPYHVVEMVLLGYQGRLMALETQKN